MLQRLLHLADLRDLVAPTQHHYLVTHTAARSGDEVAVGMVLDAAIQRLERAGMCHRIGVRDWRGVREWWG